ncbi:MAG TPA: hypothetical protein VFP46_02535 [Candidatus Paceibacterota bacterium]|nr:hypothetical protein [Candidatus Paceibacterota bacterium]
MTDFLEMHVFFAVTTAIVVILGALIGLVLWRIQRILKITERIVQVAAMESELIRHDIADLRRDLREGKGRLKALAGFVKRISIRHKRKD